MPNHARSGFSLTSIVVAMLLAVFGIAGLGGAAHATQEEDRARAEKLIQEGLTLARNKQFRDAIPKFEAALKLYPHPETKHNLGRAHEEVGELKKAHEYFTSALKDEYTFAADGRQRLMRIESELRKSFARVTVRTTPSQVTCVLSFPSGEDETHVSTPFQTWVPAGRTRLVGSNPNFRTGEQTLELSAGEDRDVSLVLIPLPKQGFLQLSVNQAGASVMVSGRLAGKSPLAGLAWEVGAYELEVKLRGYQTHREQIVINEDSVTSVNVSLLPETGDEVDAGVAPWVGWTLVGSGAVLGGVAAYLQFGKARPLQAKADLIEDQQEYEVAHQKAINYETAAVITTIVAGGLAATGLYLLIFEGGDDSTASSPTFAPSIAVTPDGGYFGGTFRF